MATTISELQEMMKDHLRGQQEDRLRFQEIERHRVQQFEEDRVRFLEMERLLNQKFQETDRKFQETDRKFKETDRVLSEKFQETDRVLSARFQETERILNEKFRETDKRVREAFELFTSQWGKLVESLVEGDLIRLLNERGVPVSDTIRRREGKRGGENYELDIIAINGVEVVIVEVKTTLRPKDVKKFLEKLGKAKIWMPEYAQNKIYGAVAYLESEAESARMAERQGLFIIKATGDSAAIANDEAFKPKVF